MGQVTPEERVDRLVRNDAPLLLSFLARRASDRSDAADLLSDVFVVLWRRRNMIPDDEAEARAYALGIARNVLLNAQRAVARRTALVERLRAVLAQQPAPPDEEVLAEDILEGLDARDQVILRLVGVEDLTVQEAARALGISAASARQRLSRARRRARELRRTRLQGPTASAASADAQRGCASATAW